MKRCEISQFGYLVVVSCALLFWCVMGCSKTQEPESLLLRFEAVNEGKAEPITNRLELLSFGIFLRSKSTIERTERELDLAERWGQTEKGAQKRLRKALFHDVREGGNLVIGVQGLEKEIALEILHSLTREYTEQDTWIDVNALSPSVSSNRSVRVKAYISSGLKTHP